MRCLLFFALLTAGAPAFAGQQAVEFKTSDGCAIAAFYLAPSTGSYVFINAHGLGSGKYEWEPFQNALKARGLGYLSLDLRGHGGSLNCAGGEVNYKAFTKAAWNNISRDIQAAAAWLKKKKISAVKMVFCGASIGANLALKAAAEGPVKPAAVLLLSPGLEYAGVKAGLYLPAGPRPRLLIAAAQDDAYAWQSGQYLARAGAAKGAAIVFLAGQSGHGVNLFAQPGLMDELIDSVLGQGKIQPKK